MTFGDGELLEALLRRRATCVRELAVAVRGAVRQQTTPEAVARIELNIRVRCFISARSVAPHHDGAVIATQSIAVVLAGEQGLERLARRGVELAGVVRSPAGSRAVGSQGAGMAKAGDELREHVVGRHE